METCINYCDRDGITYISSDERRWISRIKMLSAKKPDECIIIKRPEDNGGFVYARFPQKWVRVNPPRLVIMTDEQRANLTQRMRSTRHPATTESNGGDGQ